MRWLDTDEFDPTVVGLVSGGHFFSHFYLLVFPPLFPVLRVQFGLSNVELGLIMSAVQVGTFLQVAAGDVVDRIGGKRVFLAGLVVSALGIGLAGVAGSYVLLLVFALVSSVGQAAFHPADYALLSGASGEGHVGKSFALHSFAGSLGFAAAPLVVGAVALLSNWQVALVVAGAAGLAYAFVAFLLLGDVDRRGTETTDGTDGPAGRASLRDPTLLALFGFVFLTVFGSIGVQTFTPVLVVDGFHLGEAVGGSALSAFFVAFAGAVLVGGVLADRLRPHLVIVGGVGGSAILIWAVAARLVPPVPTAILAVFAVMGAASGLYLPSRDRLISAASPRGSTGRSFGFVLTGISLAGVVAPAVLGAVIDASSVWLAYWVIGAVVAVGALVVVAIARWSLDRERSGVGAA